MTPLDRKLLRDLWRIKLQAFAIMLVVGAGVLLLVMMDGLVNSLEQTRQAYYERYRLADVFAPTKRAPLSLLERIEEIDGVRTVEHRVVGGALVNIDANPTPIRAQAVSLPNYREARLNRVYLSEGAMLSGRNPDDILLLEGFAKAHNLSPGDSLRATMNGARRTFSIVGLAQAPEFVLTTAPGEFAPDDSRFAVFWMNESALAAAFDVDGAFNEALVALERNAEPEPVIAALDRLLDPYGGTGSYALRDLPSDRFVSEEISGLRISSRFVPPVFMAVAAFLLYIVVSRIISSERMQIGLLKAFGYSSIEIGLHYLKLVLIISVGGALIGSGFGILYGQAQAETFQKFYKFPFLIFEVDPKTFLIAIIASVISASAGGLIVLRRIDKLTPAEAMRPPAPEDYTNSAQLFTALKGYLDQPTRMVIRRLARQPLRAASAVVGIAAGMGISVAMLSVLTGFDQTMDHNFTAIDRSDATVSFIEPLGEQTLFALNNIEGVHSVEPFRVVSVVFRNGVHSYRGALSGLVAEPRLNRPMTIEQRPIYVRSDGVILSVPLAKKLNIKPGDRLTVEVREGRRPVLEIPIAGISETLIGAPAYFELSALNRALKEPRRSSGAYLYVDQKFEADIYERIKDMPAIAGLSAKAEARASVQKLMDEGAGSQRYIMMAIAAIITFGIVFNSARIAFSERMHDLASLRVMGFSKNECAYVLLGEFVVILLVALPFGILAGHLLAQAIANGFSNELYTISASLTPRGIGIASLVVVLSAVFSGWIVKRDVDRLDMVTALKSRE